jgi:predicted DNA-binding transcriptional regulator AlpA
MNQQQLIYNDLQTRYKRATISKREMANELGISYSTIDNYIAKGYGIPNYKKLGKKANSKVVFSLIDVAEFLSQTIKTA